MKSESILTDENLQELAETGTKDFPFAMYKQLIIPDGILNSPHWHHEIQILIMLKGNAFFETSVGDFNIREGEGLFLNSGITHEITYAKDKESQYLCANFDPRILYDDDSSMYGSYIQPVLNSNTLQVIALKNELWHKEVLEMIKTMADIEEKHEFGYEIAIKYDLLKIWQSIVFHNRSEIESLTNISFQDRIRERKMKQYIHKNYADPLTLDEIAKHVNLSTSECCRVFKRTGNETPIRYLNNYRLNQSQTLLRHTHLNIIDVAFQCGFENCSYYILLFRKKYGVTPLEYRKNLI